jgi:RNA-directed DNA polymerase
MTLLLKSKIQPIYHSSKEDTWTGVNWSKVEKTVENLQYRITRAAEKGNYRKVRNLQRLLTVRSLSASLKAVRIVAQQNSIIKIPGIDGQLWTTPESKMIAALNLHKKLNIKPLKKVSIKHNGTQRFLDILSLSDRASQILWNIALLPYIKATSDFHSYDLRPNFGYWNANAQIRMLLSKKKSPQWVLKATIEKSFDHINYDWFLKNIPIKTKILKSWLKAKYFEKNSFELFLLEKGVPQNALISINLANYIFNEFENHLKQQFQHSLSKIEKSINIVRYNNDLIVLGRSKSQLEAIKKSINYFLAPTGFRIIEEKTLICHINEGFDFLGWTFRKFSNRQLLCNISKKSIIKHRKEIKYITKTIHQPEILISKLNSQIRGWLNYYQCANGIWKVWKSMNQYLYERLLKWGLKHHGNKTTKWVFNKYWKHINNRWTFTGTTKYGRTNYIKKTQIPQLIKYNLPHKKLELESIKQKKGFEVLNSLQFDCKSKNYKVQ